MCDIQQAATLLWQTINGALESSQDLAMVFDTVPGKPPNNDAAGRARLAKALSRQPTTPELVSRWHAAFAPTVQISKTEALTFFNEVMASLEDIDELFPMEGYAGETVMRKGYVGDYTVKRVQTRRKGWSLHLTVEGSGIYNCIRQQLVTAKGDLVLISPDGIYDYHRHAQSESWVHHWAYFNHDGDWSRWLQWPELGAGIHHLHADEHHYSLVSALLLDCIATTDSNSPYSIDLLKNLIEQLLIRCQQLQPISASKSLNDKVVRVTRYIADHYAEDFDLQLLADEVCLSRPRLSALFKEQLGVSVMRWRDEKRLTKACEYLANSSIAINQIAEMVGYKDPHYFSRTFNQHLSCSPREYRKHRTGLKKKPSSETLLGKCRLG